MGSFSLRLKLFLKDRTAVICWFACAAVMAAVLLELDLHAAQRAAVPIGLEVKESGVLCAATRDRILHNDALYTYEGDYESLNTLLADGYIYCIISMAPDFDERLINGDTKGIMTMYSVKDNKVAALVGDIVAGCIMDAVCMYKSYSVYEGLQRDNDMLNSDGIPGDIAEYADLLKSMENSGDYDYDFDIHYTDTGRVDNRVLSNETVYRQIIAGLMGLLLMLAVFCSCSAITREYEQGIRKRIDCSPQNRFMASAGEICALFLCSSPLAFVVLIFSKDHGPGDIIAMMGINLGLILFSVFIYYTAAVITRSISAYQLLGSVMLIGLGTCGIAGVFAGVLELGFLKITPLFIYIEMMSRHF